MTILFCGGELDDFVVFGTVAHDNSSSNFRSAYSRTSIAPTGSAFATNYIRGSFSSASSSFSVSCRIYSGAQFTAANPFIWLSTGGSARLRLVTNSGTPSTITLQSYTSGGSATTLATSTLTLVANTLYRLDMIVDYGTSGRVRVYIDQTLYLDTGTMDVTASSATTLDSVNLGPPRSSSASCAYAEVIVCTQDSRTLSLKTMVPDAAGTTSSWSGAYTDIDEITASDVDVLTSATAMQVTSVNTTGMPSGWSNLTVTAVKCLASAARGSTGPSKLALGVRTNSTDSFPTAVTLDTGFSTPTTTYYELNPVTGVAWTTTEIDALQLAFRSET